MTEPLHFVCMATGDFYGRAELYITRLHRMLQRHAGRAFQLWCFTDRPRNLPAHIRQVDCASWTELLQPGMRATTRKLGLFNPAYTGLREFIYLDLTLVIRADMTALIDHALASPHDLVILRDWNHGGYNSSVMRIRPHGLAFIYQAFVSGKRYAQKVKGDQEYIHAAVADHGATDRVALFPHSLVASFKLAVRTGLTDPGAARAAIHGAVIVKFHGNPRMHRALHPVFRTFKYHLRFWLRGRATPFSLRALAQAWKGHATRP